MSSEIPKPMELDMGYVYKITNTVNGKAYIGISIHEPKKRRIKDHLSGRGNRIIANAVKKCGKDAFVYEILEANVFDEFLPDLEVAYIANYNTVVPNGYNLDSGGSHAIPSEETRRKISEGNKGKRLSAETRRKISEGNKGKVISEETRRKLSETHKKPLLGKRLSAETRRKISEGNKGKVISEETRRKLSEAHKGKTISAKTRRKMSEAQKKRSDEISRSKKRAGYWKGERNPNFGNRHPDYNSAHSYFFSLPSEMPLREKRQLMYSKFLNVAKQTIRKWVQKWLSRA